MIYFLVYFIKMKKLLKHSENYYTLDKEIRIKKKKKYNTDEFARMHWDESLWNIDSFWFLRSDDWVLVTVKNQTWLYNFMKKHWFASCDYDSKPYWLIKFYK